MLFIYCLYFYILCKKIEFFSYIELHPIWEKISFLFLLGKNLNKKFPRPSFFFFSFILLPLDDEKKKED